MALTSNPNSLPTILIVVAMQAELDAISRTLGTGTPLTLPKPLSQGTEYKTKRSSIFVVQTGIGAANAAATVALISNTYKIDQIILLGVCGSLSDEADIGDFIVAHSIVQHDSVFSGENGNELMAPGQHYVSVQIEEERVSPVFDLKNQFTKELSSLLLIQRPALKLHFGVLLSGAEFVGSSQRKQALAKTHPNAIGVEMEAAGIAVFARRLEIPISVIKTVADRVNPDGSIVNDYRLFISKASENAALVVGLLIGVHDA